MIGEFLKAELYSSRFRKGSLKALQMLGYEEDLLDNPDYANADQNTQRAKVLGLTRGWPDEWLFTNFPKNVEWFLINLSQHELAQAYRLKSKPAMTKNERLLSTTARNVKAGKKIRNVDPDLVNQMIEKIDQCQPLPPIILVAKNLESQKVLIEGHSRSIAYCSAQEKYLHNGISAILGISATMSEWEYF